MRAKTRQRISYDLRTCLLHAPRAGGRREGVAQRQRTYDSTHISTHDDLLTRLVPCIALVASCRTQVRATTHSHRTAEGPAWEPTR